MKIAVLGGGNGSLAAAGDFALAGHDVRLWRRAEGRTLASLGLGHLDAAGLQALLAQGFRWPTPGHSLYASRCRLG